MKSLIAALVTASSIFAITPAVEAATINVMVFQEDWDEDSVARNNRIQNNVLSTFNSTLNAPAYQSVLARYGITGMDVYDENSLTLDFYQTDRTRRQDVELISIARTIDNPRLDVMVPYTLYARAVTDPYTNIVKLQMSLNYRALGVSDGRFLAGENLDIDTAGIPFTGCAASLKGTAADPHCVKEFVAENGQSLARRAGEKLAIQLAGLLGRAYGTENAAIQAPTGGDTNGAIVGGTPAVQSAHNCGSIPTTFEVTWHGFEQRQINAIEEHMHFWKCALEVDISNSDFSEVTFSYKTRADRQRVIRNIRLMLELMGTVAEPRTEGRNGIMVEALLIREN